MAVSSEAGRTEPERLWRLQSLSVLDTEPEALFDGITRLAADICGVPIALMTLVDVERQWFKANHGLPGIEQTPRAVSFCARAIEHEGLMEVPDALLDSRFADNPLVTGAPGIRFYAGMPIVMPAGERIGALCVIDRQPRCLDAAQAATLASLGRLIATALLDREERLSFKQELMGSQQSYRSIVETQTELISLAEEDGTLIFVNEAYARFFGSKPDTMIGRPLTEFVDEADRAAVLAHWRAIARTGAPSSGLNRMLSADGSERWVAWTNRCVRTGAQGTLAIQSVGRDVTAQRQAELALVEAERRNRAQYIATPAMLQSIDKDGRLIEVSNMWLAKLGYRREDVVGRFSSQFLAPESQRRAREVVLPEFLGSGRCDGIEFQMVRKDGSLLDVSLSATLERDPLGNPVGSLAVMLDLTEQRAAAAALDESEHRLQSVLDALPLRMSYWDAARRLRFANQAFRQQMPGVATNGKRADEVFEAPWYGRIREGLEAGFRGRDAQIEADVVGRDGVEHIVDLRFVPDQRFGQASGLFVFSFDITERRGLERQLAQEQRQFKTLVEGIPDYAVFMLDAEGRVATWNIGAERSKGFRAEEVLGQHFRVFFTPEDRAAGIPEQELAQALRHRSFQSEGWRVRRDGSRFWAALLLSAIRDGEGKLLGFATVERDLTEQRRQQDLLLRVAELAPCALLLADPAGRITMVNAETERLFGYTRNELLGRPIAQLLPLETRAALGDFDHTDLTATVTRPMGLGQHLLGQHKNGEEFPIEIGLSPIDSNDGVSTLAAIYDVTDRRRRERETERSLAEKENLLREVYHRVKNNLQVVQSLLSLQRQALAEGAAHRALGETSLRVRSMALVHEMLYQSGDLAAVPLQQYTRNLMRQIIDAHGSDVEVRTDIPNMETGLDNAVPLGLLLTELTTNCLKHAFVDGPGGTVRVSLDRRVDGDLLTVADNGRGFGEGFDPEHVANSMGLRMASGLAKQLGGQLSCRTEQGAVVSVLLKHL